MGVVIRGRRHLVIGAVCAWALAVAGLAGCNSGGTPERPAASPTTGATVSATTTPTSSTPPGSPGATVASCAERTLRKLSLAERVGQLFMGGVLVDRTPAVVSATLGSTHVGAVLLVGQATGGTQVVERAVTRARAVTGSPAGVQPLVAADQEGGLVQHLKGPGFQTIPSASEQGEMTPTQLRRRAEAWGEDLRAAGVNVDLAPVADVVPAAIGAANRPIGALHRGYGSDPAVVGEHVGAFVAGMDDAGVATTVKHFPGLGKVRGNTDFVSGVVDQWTTRADQDLASFRAGLDAGAQFLMVSLATYTKIDPDRRAVFSPTVIGGMVRHDLAFDGVVVSDDLGVAAEVRNIPRARRAVDFLRAGGDLIVTVTPNGLPTMTRAVIGAARSDAAFRSDVDQHVLRVLATKHSMGLLTCP